MPIHADRERAIENAQTPLEKAEALNALAWKIRNSDYLRSKSLAEDALRLYELHINPNEPEQLWLIQKANALLTLSKYSGRTKNHTLSLSQSQEALAIFEQTADKYGQALALNRLGIVNFQLGAYAKALINHDKCFLLNQENHDISGQANTIINIGNVYFELADFAKALDHYHKSLKLFTELDDQTGQLRSLHNIGIVYCELADYQKAVEYLHNSLSVATALRDLQLQASSHNNLGNIYCKLADYQQALIHHQNCLFVAATISDLQLKARSYNNLGNDYFQLTDYENALANLTKSLSLFEELGDRCGQVHSLLAFGKTYIKLQRFDEAETQLQHALTVCDELGLKKERYDVLEVIAEICFEKGDSTQAYHFYKQFHLAKEDVFNHEQQKKLTRLEIIFETEQAKKEADLLRTKNEELANALNEIQRLKELVTMCAWTGKVKMNHKWVRVEEYLQQTFGIEVTHGISDDVLEAYLKQLQNNKDVQ